MLIGKIFQKAHSSYTSFGIISSTITMVRSNRHLQAMWLMSAAEALNLDKLKLESWINFLTPLNFPMFSIISPHSFTVLEPKKCGYRNSCNIIQLSKYFLEGPVYKVQ